jgi:hypothetical protein
MSKRDNPEGDKPSDESKEAPLADKGPKRLPPNDWAKARGYLLSPNVTANEVLGTGPHWDWKHAAADAMHGWKHHEFHAGAPLLLTAEDYDAAIKAATKPEGHPEQHAPAVSPHLKPQE